jgi:hypothetical protein
MFVPMTFWDIAAGILIGAGLIMGMVWGAKRGGSERPFFWICGALACFVILWRGAVWHDGTERAKADLYAKYGITPVNHQ